MSVVTVVSLLAVLGLVIVHLFSNRLRFLNVTPRSIWLSIFGGISVSYVFVHLLPELAEARRQSSRRWMRAGDWPSCRVTST